MVKAPRKQKEANFLLEPVISASCVFCPRKHLRPDGLLDANPALTYQRTLDAQQPGQAQVRETKNFHQRKTCRQEPSINAVRRQGR